MNLEVVCRKFLDLAYMVQILEFWCRCWALCINAKDCCLLVGLCCFLVFFAFFVGTVNRPVFQEIVVHLWCCNRTPQTGWSVMTTNVSRSVGTAFGEGLLAASLWQKVEGQEGADKKLGEASFIRALIPSLREEPSRPRQILIPSRPQLLIPSHWQHLDFEGDFWMFKS